WDRRQRRPWNGYGAPAGARGRVLVPSHRRGAKGASSSQARSTTKPHAEIGNCLETARPVVEQAAVEGSDVDAQELAATAERLPASASRSATATRKGCATRLRLGVPLPTVTRGPQKRGRFWPAKRPRFSGLLCRNCAHHW